MSVLKTINSPDAGPLQDGSESEQPTQAIVQRSKRQARRRSARLTGARIAFGILLIVAWQFVSLTFDLELYISRPTQIWGRFLSWWSDGTLVDAIRVTMTEAFIGFGLGCVAGCIAGFVLGRITYLGKLLEPPLLAVYSVPKIALAPLFVLWLGIGVQTKIAIAMLVVFFIVFFTTFKGSQQIDERLVDQARIMGATRWEIGWKIILPQSTAWMFAGMRMALPHALTGAVVGEFIASTAGVGFEIKNSAQQLDTAGVYAGVVILMILALLLLALVSSIETRTSRWSPRSLREAEALAT